MSTAKHEDAPWWHTDSGVRNRAGYICHMNLPTRWPDQEERYLRECAERVMSKNLIAAAPELLEALIDCRLALEIANFTQELAVVDAAISKATRSAA